MFCPKWWRNGTSMNGRPAAVSSMQVVVTPGPQWVMAELVRVFHNLPTDGAQAVVDALVERTIPLIWEFEGQKRVLDPKLSKKNQTLLLLHGSIGWVNEDTLRGWVEHSNPSVYRRDILRPAHKDRLIEYDAAGKRVRLSPKGAKEVGDKLLPKAT